MVRLILIIALRFCCFTDLMVLLHQLQMVLQPVMMMRRRRRKMMIYVQQRRLVLIELNDAGNCNTFINA